MAYEYLTGILEISNVFISIFVLIYAWSFLRQTADVRDRKPWVYLFIAAVAFFLFEVAGVLNVFNISHIPGLRSFFESAFIALILFVFIFQYDLILKSDLILITKKIAREELQEKEDYIAKKLNSPILQQKIIVPEDIEVIVEKKSPTKKVATKKPKKATIKKTTKKTTSKKVKKSSSKKKVITKKKPVKKKVTKKKKR